MRNLKITIEYDGSRYAGWQRQKNAVSVQQAIEDALNEIIQEKVKLTGAGRTDAGVHAAGQVANFTTSSSLPLYNIHRGVNSVLPHDIAIIDVEEVADTFNARRDARLRHYRYQVMNRQSPPALYRAYYWHVPQKLNIEKMKAIASLVEGEHDFSGFRSQLCTARRTRLTMQEISVVAAPPRITIDFRCRSFLHNMVRIIIGLMVEAGKGKLPVRVCEEMLETGTRNPRVPTASPNGLTLMNVQYTKV